MNQNFEVRLIAVGKLKESYLREAEDKLSTVLRKKVRLTLWEVPDEKTKEGASEKEIEKVKTLEGKKMLKHFLPSGKIVAMDLRGKKLKSGEFQRMMQKFSEEETAVQFVIGGSLGISEEILSMAHQKISFGEMTYPHQLFRIMLLEELGKIEDRV